MPNNKDIYWVRLDPFSNKVSLFVKTMDNHVSKHAFDKFPVSEEHIYQAITNPDHARRSLDPVIGGESCIFEKFFPLEQQRIFTAVIYDGVKEPGDYDKGGKEGRVSTAYFPARPNNSKFVGEIFWSKPTNVVETTFVPKPHDDDKEKE